MAILRLCGWTGCTKVIKNEAKYCSKHQAIHAEAEKARHTEYRLKRPDKKEQDFYNTLEWKRIRDVARAMQNGVDVFSYYILDKVEEAETYHHIIEIKEDWTRRLDIDNLIGLTESNHRRIHKLYNKSIRDKKQIQKLLFNLVQRYYKEFG
ncbi:hypothetical protein [Clostridium tunisiense]|uniref:hypothetical protein n=1 Tax=Clostridium tunisiense TaxID=219748 RepID=UPI0002ECE9DD|nr:hypothetical protein [Clostridium tunisiense]